MNGELNYERGLKAEALVVDQLLAKGVEVLEQRWRCPHGELDLVCRSEREIAFVEVKHAATHAIAATRLSRGQIGRIKRAALTYMSKLEGAAEIDMRFHVATVDRFGSIKWIADAFTE